MATSTKNTKFHLSPAISTFTSQTPLTVTKAKPAVVGIASVAGLVAGDIVYIPTGGTGFPEIDGKAWVIGAVNTGPNTFTLLGSDTTASTGTLLATPVLRTTVAGGLVALTCALAEFSISVDNPGNISTATYCDPSAQIPSSVVSAGSASWKSYVDNTSAGYTNLLSAVDDGLERVIRVTLPNAQGYLLAPGYASSYGFAVPLDGVVEASGQFTLSSKFRHLY